MSESTTRWLQLFGLSSFAIAQPLLDLLGREPGFFVARQSTPGEILLLLLLLLLVPPLLLWTAAWLAERLGAAAGAALHAFFLALLGAMIAVPILKKAPVLPSAALFAIAIALGAALAIGGRRAPPLRSFLSLLGLAPLVFALLFLSRPDVARLTFGVGEPEVPTPVVASPHPVVMVVFDELPLTSLLDEQGAIDPVRYPAFARLAREATWFPDATTVDWETHQAIPAILTGRYPGPRRSLPVEYEHPYNLFRFAEASYEVNAVETQTRIHAGGDAARPPFALRMIASLSDLALVYLLLLAPPPRECPPSPR